MRNYVILMSATALSACSGGGAQTAGSVPVSSGTVATTGGSTGAASTFANPTQTKTYQAQGGVQTYRYDYNEALSYTKVKIKDAGGMDVLDALGNPTYKVDPNTRTLNGTAQSGQFYSANASTVRSPGVTVTYDPRNAQFTLQLSQNGLSDNIVFQDPAHRTNFGGATTPQLGVPNLEVAGASSQAARGVQYLEVDSGSSGTVYDVSTFFYEKAGVTTPNGSTPQYVSYAGFVRNHYDAKTEALVADFTTSQTTLAKRPTSYERATFVFGEQTAVSAVPKTGSANFTGNMIASMVNNPSFDTDPNAATYFQWLTGTANIGVNFATGAVTTSVNGTTLAPLRDPTPIFSPTALAPGFTYQNAAIPAGAIFSATGTAQIDLVATGGFTGTFANAQFVSGGVTTPLTIAGSSLDGAFYGPAANEVGASFRIVGGIPDQRVDIIGAFTGK